MKIYPKKLNSLEDLRREKQVLLYAKKHTAKLDILPKASITKKQEDAVDSTTDAMAVAGDLLTSGNIADMAMTLGLPFVKFVGLKAGKGLFKGFFKEIFLGYMKWKLVHFGITTAMDIVKSKNGNKKTK